MFQKIVRIIRPYNAIRTTTNQTEYKISKKLQSFFFPFNFLESLFLSPKYRIHDNIIKPYGFKATAFCIIGNLVVIFVWISRGLSVDEFLYETKRRLSEIDKLQNLFANLAHNLNYFLFAVGFLTNMFSSIAQRRNMVNLVIKIQKILYVVNLRDEIFSKVILRCWFYCFSMITLFLAYYATLHFFFSSDSLTLRLWNFISDIPLMIFDVHMIFAMNVVILLRNIAFEITSTISCENNDNEFCKEICKVYVEILEVFDNYNVVFQDLVRSILYNNIKLYRRLDRSS